MRHGRWLLLPEPSVLKILAMRKGRNGRNAKNICGGYLSSLLILEMVINSAGLP
jgi:hypothetical protein